MMFKAVRRLLILISAVWISAFATAASAQGTLTNPQGSGVIVSAVQWLQGTLLGTVATVVAVIAIASVGFLMLTGRINWRYGATVTQSGIVRPTLQRSER